MWIDSCAGDDPGRHLRESGRITGLEKRKEQAKGAAMIKAIAMNPTVTKFNAAKPITLVVFVCLVLWTGVAAGAAVLAGQVPAAQTGALAVDWGPRPLPPVLAGRVPGGVSARVARWTLGS